MGCMGLHGILDLLQPNSIAMNSNFQQQAPQGQVGYEGGQGQYNLGQQAGAPPAVHTAVTIWHTCSILGRPITSLWRLLSMNWLCSC